MSKASEKICRPFVSELTCPSPVLTGQSGEHNSRLAHARAASYRCSVKISILCHSLHMPMSCFEMHVFDSQLTTKQAFLSISGKFDYRFDQHCIRNLSVTFDIALMRAKLSKYSTCKYKVIR